MSKPEEKKRTENFKFRLTRAQMEMFREAAESAGITISAWMVERLVSAAKKERTDETVH